MTDGPWGPDPALVSSSAHVFVESLDHPSLGDADAHHLGRVLRLRDGEIVSITDGHGRWRLCEFRKTDVSLVVAGDIQSPNVGPATFGVAVSVPKGDRIDNVVQKITEIGAACIVLFRSDHSIVRWDEGQAERQLSRLRAIARSASMQSRRLSLPTLSVVSSLDALLAQGDLVIATIDGPPMVQASEHRVVAVGPEGGWSSRERDIAIRGPHATVGLGSTVLRTDTAAVAAAVVLAFHQR